MPLKITPKTFGAAFSAARKRGDKTFEFKGEKYTTQTKEEKDREVTPEAKKVMDQTRRDREGNFRAQARKSDVDMETPEERGAMNLEGFKRERGTSTGLTDKDRDEFKRLSDTAVSQEGRLGTMKKGGSVKVLSLPKWAKLKQLSLLWAVHLNVLTVLLKKAKPVEKWSDVFNEQHSVL
jgi:hypothetical protein